MQYSARHTCCKRKEKKKNQRALKIFPSLLSYLAVLAKLIKCSNVETETCNMQDAVAQDKKSLHDDSSHGQRAGLHVSRSSPWMSGLAAGISRVELWGGRGSGLAGGQMIKCSNVETETCNIQDAVVQDKKSAS